MMMKLSTAISNVYTTIS